MLDFSNNFRHNFLLLDSMPIRILRKDKIFSKNYLFLAIS